MSDYEIEPVATQDAQTQAALLALNNLHARETSYLTEDQWRALIANASIARCAGKTAALLIAFTEDASYDNQNFAWFRQRMDRFAYVDRIVVDGNHRGAGLARRLYEDLFASLQDAGQDRVVCEVNMDPPNPQSDAFHDRLGFLEVGQATLVHSGKTVRYLEKRLSPMV